MFKILGNLFVLSINILASSTINCDDPKNINSCAKITFTKTEIAYNSFIQSALIKFNEKTNSNYVNNFLEIEKHWKNLVNLQCNHLRKSYDGGSLGSSNYIACYDFMYENRINELKLIYDDILGER